jgi:asparagine synthetase B (glutamine-hydrolysing)
VTALTDHVSVVFDGALHRCPDVDAELVSRSAAHLTDAARLAYAYERRGEGILNELAGRYALIIWDARRELLLAARDPMGLFPLYWTTVGRDVLISPSASALLRAPGVSTEIHRAALIEYICRRWPPVEETFIRGVQRVPPGRVLRVQRGQHQLARYWEPALLERGINWIGDEELDRFDGLFTSAVERCIGSGPAGIYLSGGLDSVSVAAAAADQARRGDAATPHALSLLFAGTEIDEAQVQRDVAAALGMAQLTVPFDEAAGAAGILSAAVAMSREWPWPLLNPWTPAYQHLGAVGTERGCRVLLSGNGGDEWLTVSPIYAADLVRALDVRGLARQIAMTRQSYSMSWRPLLRILLWRYGIRPVLTETAAALMRDFTPRLIHNHRRRALEALNPSWLAPDPTLERELRWRIERRVEEGLRKGRGNQLYGREIVSNVDNFLQTMEFEEKFESGRRLAASVLAPFWDADLVRFLYRVPPRLLNWNGRSKGLVRRTLARRFPGLGFDRQPKVVVRTYYRDCLLREGPAAWRSLGGGTAMAELGLADEKALERHMTEVFSGLGVGTWGYIWPILSVEAWLRGRLGLKSEDSNGI